MVNFKDLPPDTKILNGTALRNWLLDQIDMDFSCKEDFEMIDCKENEYYKGRLDAFDEVLKLIDKK